MQIILEKEWNKGFDRKGFCSETSITLHWMQTSNLADGLSSNCVTHQKCTIHSILQSFLTNIVSQSNTSSHTVSHESQMQFAAFIWSVIT